MEVVITHDFVTITTQTSKRCAGYGWRYRIGAKDWVNNPADHLLATECLALDTALRTAKRSIDEPEKASGGVIENQRPEQRPE